MAKKVKIGSVYVDITAKKDKLDKDLKVVKKQLTGVGVQAAKTRGIISKMFSGLGGKLSGLLGLGTLAKLFKDGFNASREFEKGMRNVNSIINVSDKELKKLGKGLINISKELGTPSTELTGALYQLVSAGISAADSIEFLDIAGRASIAGLTDTKTAVDGLTTVLNAFHISADQTEKVADVMFQTVKLGKTTFPELASSMSIVASIAAASGIEFEQVSAAIATLTKQGVPTSVAVTQIRQAIVGLNQIMGDGWAKTMSLQDAFKELNTRAGGSQSVLQKMLGRIEGVNAVLGLTGKNAITAASDLNAMNTALGSMGIAFNQQAITMDIKIKKLKASYEELARTITNQFAPLLSEVLQDLNLIFSIGDGKTAKKQMPWDKTLLKDGIDLIKEFFAIPERFANQFDLTFDTSIKAPKGLKVFEDPKALDFLDKKIRRIGNGVVTITDEVNKFKDKFKSSSVTIGEVKKEIEKLKTEQDNLVFGSTSYKENVAEINKLIKSITPEIKKQADALIAATDRARAIITPVTAIEIKQTGEANKPKAISDSKESVDRFNESLKTTDELSSSISQGFEAAGNELAYTMSNAVRLFGQANSVLEQFLDTLIRVAIQAAVMKAFSFIFGAILAPFTGGASLTGAGVSGTAAPQISDIPTLNTLNNSFPTNTGYAGLGRKIELLNKSINKVNASVQAMNLNMINGKPVQVAIITSDPTARVKGDMAVRNRMLRGGVNEMELM